MKYFKGKFELDDNKIIKDLRKAADMYENGEIVETTDILIYIVAALREYSALWTKEGEE